jgi:predicted transcriptional regulator
MIAEFVVGTKGQMSHRGCGKAEAPLTIWIGDLNVPAYNSVMEISLAPEVEARLTRIASEAGKAANQLVQELVADYLGHDEWFKREVQKGLISLDSGKFVSHEEVGRRMERILGS